MAKTRRPQRQYAGGKTVRFTDFHIGISSVNFEISKAHLEELVRQFESIKAEHGRFTITLTRIKKTGLPDRIQVSGRP